ncbi:DUF2161 domain-containing phosphodiesterase [Roseibacterium sp. SDUM158017]|uniref:DUF2161 domain-containing phosphodiesterase n=1 Tax=Roseicyclus salinarum TaxID=3036773 RepID=UPI002414EE09|nr:DUF2161 domain-containing phosphodiesterase [Roseibacterium sp. SDUM158017]MDG4647431.1 DUF2161 domain-containing phosphodiesterase [Roseibacterium sp. SDUM158017]
MGSKITETELYPPVKSFLESLGYEVKAEIGPADVMAVRDGAPPVIVELKTGFSLTLFHQGIARLSVCDDVYLAVPRGSGRRFLRALSENVRLARRLGLGLLTVRLETGLVEVHCDPGPYAPRKSARRAHALLGEFARRRGDPNLGGARGGRVTAYRQDALACAAHLAARGASKGAAVRDATGVTRATAIMRDNHYGWFVRIGTGIYTLSEAGTEAVDAD